MQPQATTTSGRVQGFVEEDTAAFLGIPYSAPPVGERRFAAPRPPEPWDGVRDVLEYGPTAPQPDRGITIIPEPVVPGDDYLNLNVFTPDPGTGGLPVLVWIHGGGFTSGCNRSPWYNGKRFARDGVVVVAINYRLGAEGFMAIDGAPHNRAVLDWVAALGWVRDNISSFGGDPSKVTIAGQSAGGAASCILLAVPQAAGLFHRAICMSGSVPQKVSLDDARAAAARVAESLGVRPTLDELARIPAQDIVAAQGNGGLAWACVDGEVLPEFPLTAIRRGASADIDVMVGATTHEVTGMAGRGADADRLRRRLERMGLPGDRIDRLVAHAPETAPDILLGQAVTDTMFRVPGIRLSEARAGAPAGTYHYEFTWRSPALGHQAFHCLDIPFAWDLLDAHDAQRSTGQNPPQELADAIHTAWVDFITDGDPGWPRYDLDRRLTRVWDVPARTDEDVLAFERTLWDGVR